MQEIFLAKIDADKNEYRYYRLVLPPGSTALLRQWGRIGDYTHEKWDELPDRETAEKVFETAEREKRRDGYATADKSIFPKNYMFYAPRTSQKSLGAS